MTIAIQYDNGHSVWLKVMWLDLGVATLDGFARTMGCFGLLLSSQLDLAFPHGQYCRHPMSAVL